MISLKEVGIQILSINIIPNCSICFSCFLRYSWSLFVYKYNKYYFSIKKKVLWFNFDTFNIKLNCLKNIAIHNRIKVTVIGQDKNRWLLYERIRRICW